MRITENTPSEISAAAAMKSCRNPSSGQRPISGMWKSWSNSAPYASRYTVIKITKAQNVKKCASPGTDHRSSLRWPNTSTNCALIRSFSCCKPVVRRLSGLDERVEPVGAAARHRQGENCHRQSDDESDNHGLPPTLA